MSVFTIIETCVCTMLLVTHTVCTYIHACVCSGLVDSKSSYPKAES